MYALDRRRYVWVGVSALIQGLLLGTYIYADVGFFLAAPLTLVIIVPFAFWLAQEHWGRRLKRFLGALTAVLSIFFAYWLWSSWPADAEIFFLPPQYMNFTRMCAAVFLFLPFFQCRIATYRWRVPYSEVFFQLCRNVFLLFQAVIVTGIFWALLLTASRLFAIIGLEFVPQIAFSPLVAFPLTSLTIAFSITLALKHPGIDSLGRWILAILAWLLPPFSLLSTVFVVSLPFSGLKTLWVTGQASSLMLLLQFATILLANVAWLDGTRAPFSNKAVETATKFSLLSLPIYTGLCLYSLGLRVQQYGWSVDRVEAAFFVAMAAIWGIGYAGAVLLDAITQLLRWRLERRAASWPSSIGKINTVAALLLALIVMAMNSPLLDPYRLSANNQVDRLLTRRASPENFDFSYLRFNLGRYGNSALSRLVEIEGIAGADVIRAKVTEALSETARDHWASIRDGVVSEKTRRGILASAKVYPEGRELPQTLVDSLVRQWGSSDYSLRDVRSGSDLAFLFKELGPDDGVESLLLVRNGMGLLLDVSSPEPVIVGAVYGDLDPSYTRDAEALEPKFKDISLGGARYQIAPR
jgi:hypothetical protein